MASSTAAVGSYIVPPTHRPKAVAKDAAKLPQLGNSSYRHLTGYIGTVVENFDLTTATNEDIKAIKQLLAKRGVLHFPNQLKMGNKEQVEFCRKIGKSYCHKSYKAEEFEDLMKLHTDENSQFVFGAEALHADITYEQIPAQWTCLRITVCPDVGGDTSFTFMPGVLDKFSAGLRSIFRQHSAVHESYHAFRTNYGAVHRQVGEDGNKGANAAAVDAPEYPEAIHPMVIKHPETGSDSLYVNRAFTTKILGMPSVESKALLALIHDVTSNASEYQCRISWTPNSVTIWDNYIVQHSANFDYPGQTRTGFRVTMLAEKAPEPASGAAKL